MKRAAALAFALLFFSNVAAAESDKALAKAAYDRGVAAQARGDFKRAAEEFASADVLAPSAVALEAALDAAVDADDPVLGAELLARSKRTTPTGTLATSVAAATTKLGGRAGRVKVSCPTGARCTARIDTAPFEPAKGAWVRVGPHTLVVDLDGVPDTRTVQVRADEELEVMPTRAAPPVAPLLVPPPAGAAEPNAATPDGNVKPLPPVVFYVGAGATLVLASVSIVFGVTARRKHDDFAGASCDTVVGAEGCQGLKDDGESAQRIANIGFAATAVAGVASVVVGVFFTRWAHAAKSGHAPLVIPVPGGIAAGYAARF